jgi:hypothetical protein
MIDAPMMNDDEELEVQSSIQYKKYEKYPYSNKNRSSFNNGNKFWNSIIDTMFFKTLPFTIPSIAIFWIWFAVLISLGGGSGNNSNDSNDNENIDANDSIFNFFFEPAIELGVNMGSFAILEFAVIGVFGSLLFRAYTTYQEQYGDLGGMMDGLTFNVDFIVNKIGSAEATIFYNKNTGEIVNIESMTENEMKINNVVSSRIKISHYVSEFLEYIQHLPYVCIHILRADFNLDKTGISKSVKNEIVGKYKDLFEEIDTNNPDDNSYTGLIVLEYLMGKFYRTVNVIASDKKQNLVVGSTINQLSSNFDKLKGALTRIGDRKFLGVTKFIRNTIIIGSIALLLFLLCKNRDRDTNLTERAMQQYIIISCRNII